MLLPLNSSNRELPSESDSYHFFGERQQLRIPLRECHSIRSLPPSFSQNHANWESPLPEILDSQRSPDHHSKTVRFALSRRTVQYFNPTEKPSSVHRSMSVLSQVLLC
ncbi:hypothetical protein BDV12DRAFT_168447 [Aspergillus spectabilis]